MIRLWKLGDAERGILPTREAAITLAKMLQDNEGSATTDIIWGPDIECLHIPDNSEECKDLIALDEAISKVRIFSTSIPPHIEEALANQEIENLEDIGNE